MTDAAAAEPEPTSPFKPDKEQRARSALGRFVKGEGSPTSPRRERKPRQPRQRTTTAKRESLAEGLSILYGAGGTIAAYMGEVPLGRAMQMQAPMAGRELDKLVRESDAAYAILSPFLSARKVAALEAFSFPIEVFLYDHYPTARPMITPLLRRDLIKMAKSLAKEQAKIEDELRELMETDEDLAGMVDGLFAAIFGAEGAPEAGPVGEVYGEGAEPTGSGEPTTDWPPTGAAAGSPVMFEGEPDAG
jgi:hypothetical protein